MTAIVWSDVEAVAPELSTVAAAAQTVLLGFANAEFHAANMGGEDSDRLKLARSYLAAHMATVGGFAGAGSSGPIVAESLGDASWSYGSVASMASSDELDASGYGRLLKMILKMSPLARVPVLL